jgi:hypothetical protein
MTWFRFFIGFHRLVTIFLILFEFRFIHVNLIPLRLWNALSITGIATPLEIKTGVFVQTPEGSLPSSITKRSWIVSLDSSLWSIVASLAGFSSHKAHRWSSGRSERSSSTGHFWSSRIKHASIANWKLCLFSGCCLTKCNEHRTISNRNECHWAYFLTWKSRFITRYSCDL